MSQLSELEMEIEEVVARVCDPSTPFAQMVCDREWLISNCRGEDGLRLLTGKVQIVSQVESLSEAARIFAAEIDVNATGLSAREFGEPMHLLDSQGYILGELSRIGLSANGVLGILLKLYPERRLVVPSAVLLNCDSELLQEFLSRLQVGHTIAIRLCIAAYERELGAQFAHSQQRDLILEFLRSTERHPQYQSAYAAIGGESGVYGAVKGWLDSSAYAS